MRLIKNELVDSINILTVKVSEYILNVKYYNDIFGNKTLMNEVVPSEGVIVVNCDCTIKNEIPGQTICTFEGYLDSDKKICTMVCIVSFDTITFKISESLLSSVKEYPIVSPSICKTNVNLNIKVDKKDNNPIEYHITDFNLNDDYDRGLQDGILLGRVLK